MWKTLPILSILVLRRAVHSEFWNASWCRHCMFWNINPTHSMCSMYNPLKNANTTSYQKILNYFSSPGQSFVPQARSSAESPVHSSPPFLAHFFTNLDRIWDPLSQVAEQRPHWDQGLQVQSTEMWDCFKCEFFVEGNRDWKALFLLCVMEKWSAKERF